MDNDFLRRIINIIISILIAILLVKLFIWSLPIILILLLAYYIYKKIKTININDNKDTWERKTKETTKIVKKNKKIIIDEEKD